MKICRAAIIPLYYRPKIISICPRREFPPKADQPLAENLISHLTLRAPHNAQLPPEGIEPPSHP